MGRDVVVFKFDVVSIRAPPEGSDSDGCAWRAALLTSIRSATNLYGQPGYRGSFNPRSPGGARYIAGAGPGTPLPVSIHAPPEGRDKSRTAFGSPWRCFNPRAPGGARSVQAAHCNACRNCFNPRAPGGARLFQQGSDYPYNRFQSTRPRRGAIF